MGVFRFWALRVFLLFPSPLPPPQAQLPPVFKDIFPRSVGCSKSSPCSMSLSTSSSAPVDHLLTAFAGEDLDQNQKWADSTLWQFECFLSFLWYILKLSKSWEARMCSNAPRFALSQQPCADQHKVTVSLFYLLSWCKSNCSYNNPSGFLLSAEE